MTASNGVLSGDAARFYGSSSLLPQLPGLGKAVHLPYDYCDIVKPPSSKAEKNEMALNGLVFELPATRSARNALLVFMSPEDARSGLRKIIGQHATPARWPGQELLATARGVLTGYKGEVDLIDSTDASHIFARIVAHGLSTSVVHSGDSAYDVSLRFGDFERSPWRFEAVLMLSAHMAFYWHREGNHDLEARYLAIMAYRFFTDRFGSRCHAMRMLKNIDAVYDMMTRRGDPVDGMVRDLHNTFLRVVGENHNASLDRGSRVPHWRRVQRRDPFGPRSYSLVRALRPHVCRSDMGVCMHSSHFVDDRGWGDSYFD